MWSYRNILSLFFLLFFGVYILHDIVPHHHEIDVINDLQHVDVAHTKAHSHDHSHNHSHEEENDQKQNDFLDFLFCFHAHSTQTRNYENEGDLKLVREVNSKNTKFEEESVFSFSLNFPLKEASEIPYKLLFKSFSIPPHPALRAPPAIG